MDKEFNRLVASFIINEVRQDYRKLGYHPLPPEVIHDLVVCKYNGILSHKQMVDRYKQLVNEKLAL